MIYRREHPRRFCFFDRYHRIYYYPEDFASQQVIVLPSGFEPSSINRQTYYHSNGIFYQRQNQDFTNVPPPVGALASSLPSTYVEITAGGSHYWTNNGVYYKKVAGGYEVTSPPPGFEGVLVEQAPRTVNGEDAIIVSIPDENQFIEVKLIRSGDGYRGPQGEWYPEFPRIEQLREEYL